MGSPGEAQIAVWEAAGAAFEEAHEGVTVEFNFQDDDLYQTIGLPNLLSSGNPPDVYFEWAGARLEERYAEGFALDLTSAVADTELGELFDESAFNSMTVDDKIVMVPANADVTNVIWYNVDVFAELGLTPPATWDEFVALCPTIADAGMIPMAIGNLDLWAGGNFASHIVSRVVGAEAYDAMMREELPMDAPEVVEGLEHVQQLVEQGCVNESVNAINDNEGAQLFFQGLAAMHPIGSWLVSWAIEEAPDLNFDYFNLPAIGDGEEQDSVMGVATGFVVNAHSEHADAAIEFLTLFSSPEFTAQMVEAGGTPMATWGDGPRRHRRASHPPDRRPQRGVDGDRPARHRLRPARRRRPLRRPGRGPRRAGGRRRGRRVGRRPTRGVRAASCRCEHGIGRRRTC